MKWFLIIVLSIWTGLHFSGRAVLYGRSEEERPSQAGESIFHVTCHYVASTGILDGISADFANAQRAEKFFCPRSRRVARG